MEQKQRVAVSGYVRANYDATVPIEIMQIVWEYYRFSLESAILRKEEQYAALNLLYEQFKSQRESTEIRFMETKLLYRASENEYSAAKFHDKVDSKGATFTVVHTEHDHVFGAYTSLSLKSAMSTDDANAFMMRIRPKLEICPLLKTAKGGKSAVFYYETYGPLFGGSCDFWISNQCDQNTESGCQKGSTFEFNPFELAGGEPNNQTSSLVEFQVRDYEVFSVQIRY